MKALFDKAIVGLHRCGLRNLAGLACQCFAEYALEKGDQEYASDYMKRAQEAYTGKLGLLCTALLFYSSLSISPCYNCHCIWFSSLYARLGSGGCSVVLDKEVRRLIKI